MTDLVLILTTMPDGDAAETLARTLVDERLAACVNVGERLTSIYRWQEQVEQESERPLLIKTTRDRIEALRTRLHQLHPYQLPEFVVIAADDGSEAYLNWVAAATRPSGA